MKDADGNDEFRVFKDRANNFLRNMFTAMQEVDMLQVSTPELADTYRSYNSNIVVLENCIDNQLYQKIKKPKNEKPTVIWSGTKTHIDDLYELDGNVPHNCKLIIGGFTEAKDKGLFSDHPDVEFIEGVSFLDYPEKMVALGDIVAVPLVDNKFNACKSDIKGLEHAALSIPCVASDVAPYRRWIDYDNGFLIKKNRPRKWLKYLQMLVDDAELRAQMGQKAKDKAMTRDIRNYLWRWEEVYFNE
jgi:glycosyltransferase involved in cell wall biosynthesis